MLELLDQIARLILMGFFAVFTVFSYRNYLKVKEKGLEVSSKYFLAITFFFFVSFINFFQAEINIHFHYYPDPTYYFPLIIINIPIPLNSLIFLFIFLTSLIPLVYVIEKHFQKWNYPYAAILGLICEVVLIVTIFVPLLFPFSLVFVLSSLLFILAIFLSLYAKIARRATGLIKKTTYLLIFGWVLFLITLIVPISPDPTLDGFIDHVIQIFASSLIYWGIMKTKE